MKIASKVLLILELIGLCLGVVIQAGLGVACVLGTWSAKDIETYNLCYTLSYVLLISLIAYILPFIFTIFGLCKINHHKDANNYMLSGFLVLFFASLIPGILMIVDASDEKVEAAEDQLLEEIYGHDDCECCDHDEEECEDHECECHHEHEEKECKVEECKAETEKEEPKKEHKKFHLFHKKDKEEVKEESVQEEKAPEEVKENKVETTTSGDVEIEVVNKE